MKERSEFKVKSVEATSAPAAVFLHDFADIAIVALEKPLAAKSLAKISDRLAKEKDALEIAGYGEEFDKKGDISSGRLLVREMTAQEYISDTLPAWDGLKLEKFANLKAESLEENSATSWDPKFQNVCSGDSGGPIVLKETQKLVAVTSSSSTTDIAIVCVANKNGELVWKEKATVAEFSKVMGYEKDDPSTVAFFMESSSLAESYCSKLGEDYRFPTQQEAEILFKDSGKKLLALVDNSPYMWLSEAKSQPKKINPDSRAAMEVYSGKTRWFSASPGSCERGWKGYGTSVVDYVKWIDQQLKRKECAD